MFYDIFSDKKENKEKIKVSIDFREKNSLVPSELMNMGFDIEFKSLPVADYVINDLAIERKTISDFKASIIDKRIFTQLKEIKQYPLNMLIIEGDIYDLYDNNILSSNAIKGFIISANINFKVPIIFSNDEKDTAIYIYIMSNKKSKKEISINPKKISLNKDEQIQYILESFPNIGPIKAKKLINKFDSLINIFKANEKDLEPILGKNTKEFLGLVH